MSKEPSLLRGDLELVGGVWDFAEEETEVESLDVTQCRTRTEKRTSALQHMRQIQAASP